MRSVFLLFLRYVESCLTMLFEMSIYLELSIAIRFKMVIGEEKGTYFVSGSDRA